MRCRRCNHIMRLEKYKWISHIHTNPEFHSCPRCKMVRSNYYNWNITLGEYGVCWNTYVDATMILQKTNSLPIITVTRIATINSLLPYDITLERLEKLLLLLM